MGIIIIAILVSINLYERYLEKLNSFMKRNETKFEHYTSEEILQIQIDLYNCLVYFTGDADAGHQLTFQTSIKEWREISDLDKPISLAKYYHSYFNMDTDLSELINLFSNEDNTLGMLCNYIADNSIKTTITPVVSLGSLCLEAAIFKTLKNELEKEGIDTTDFKPSTNFVAFFLKYTDEIVSIVSKLAPGTLVYYKYKSTFIGKLSASLLLLSIITPITMAVFYHITWHIIPLFAVTIIVMLISNKLEKSNQYDISGYRTVRDLVIGMKKRMDIK